jgi:hypothetical protein
MQILPDGSTRNDFQFPSSHPQIKMKTTLDWLLARLSENSTWRGLILVATAAGAHISPERSAAIISFGLAAVGLINIIRKAPKPQ